METLLEAYQKGQLIISCGPQLCVYYSIKERRDNHGTKEKSKRIKARNNIKVKLTDIELELLNQKAEMTGTSKAGYLKNLFIGTSMKVRYEIVADMQDLRKLVGEYGKIGSNLNQIAKYFNTGGERSLAMEDEIRQCISELFVLRKEVLRLAGDFRGSVKTH